MDQDTLTRLNRRARRLNPNTQDAEDLCQDVCLSYLERRANGAQIDRPLPYMMTALRHAAQHRSLIEHVPLDDDSAAEMPDATLNLLCTEVLQALEHLPKPDRALLHRVSFDGQTPSEIADEMEIPVGTIMSRLARARLRKALGFDRVF